MDNPKLLYISKKRQYQGDVIELHSHSTLECVLYITGKGTSVIGKKKYSFSAGSLAFINHNVLHNELHDTSSEIVFFNLSDCDIKISDGIYRPNNFDMLKKIAMEIYIESRSSGYMFESLMSAKAEEFLVLLKRDLIQQGTVSDNLKNLRNYLKANCCDVLDIRLSAKKFGFEYENFRYVFKKTYGISPNKFIIYNRLIHACALLENTDKSCLDIALECNFCDSAQFSKMFKKQFGISPLSYRYSTGLYPKKGKDIL